MTPPPSSLSIDMQWQEGDDQITWTYGGTKVHKTYPAAPYTVTAWPNPPSIIIVEAPHGSHSRSDNAVVFNPDGTERLRLQPPIVSAERHWDIGFYAVYPGSDGLIAVFTTQVGDFWGRPDLHTGELNNVAQWR